MVFKINEKTFDVTAVGAPKQVQFEGAPTENNPRYMALFYHQHLSAIRLVRDVDNVVKNVSEIHVVNATEDPWRFVWGDISYKPQDAPGRHVLGLEDPTVAVVNHRLILAATRVVPSRDYHRSTWTADLVFTEVDIPGKMRSIKSRRPGFYRNLAYVKELEVVVNTSTVFFETGGPGLGAMIGTGQLRPSQLDFVLDKPGIWLEPRRYYCRPDRQQKWDSTHLCPGPIIRLDDETFLMFYNGRTEGINWDGTHVNSRPEWAVGLVAFRLEGCQPPIVLFRSEEPLVRDQTAEIGYSDQIICFASSARAVGDGRYVLYAHIGDNYVVGQEIQIDKH